MGWLAAQGAIMAIGLFIGLVCSVIGLFFGHIILFDSIALGIVVGLLTLIYAAVFELLPCGNIPFVAWLFNFCANLFALCP